MATTTNGADWKSAPESYDAFYRQYQPVFVSLAAKNGIDEHNREDVASELMERCMRFDVLKKFDPNLYFDYKGEKRQARFRTYVGNFAELALRGKRDKQNTLKQRELLICDQVMNEEDDNGNKSTWREHFGKAEQEPDHADIVIEALASDQEAQAVRARLAEVAPRSPNDECDLVALFDALREQVLTYGEYRVKDLQPKFGCSNTTLANRIWWLKANLAHIYGRPVPTKRARRVGRKP